MKNHIRVLDRDRIQVENNRHSWTNGPELAITLGDFNTVSMSHDRAFALLRCLDEVLNASAIDEPIGGPAIDELDEFREEAA